jgi:acetyltransferase
LDAIRYLFKESTHEMATRFCFVDYDRTMAIVAEVDGPDGPQLVAVCRLVADADHRDAEYAVLVADAWQGRGLGTLLTDFCMEIGSTWGVGRILVETAAENQRMQWILRRYNFEKKQSAGGEELYETRIDTRPGKR